MQESEAMDSVICDDDVEAICKKVLKALGLELNWWIPSSSKVYEITKKLGECQYVSVSYIWCGLAYMATFGSLEDLVERLLGCGGDSSKSWCMGFKWNLGGLNEARVKNVFGGKSLEEAALLADLMLGGKDEHCNVCEKS